MGLYNISLEIVVVLKLNVTEVTSPLLKTGYLPLVTSCHLLGDPPPSPSGVTSFMDDPLQELSVGLVRMAKMN